MGRSAEDGGGGGDRMWVGPHCVGEEVGVDRGLPSGVW